MSTADNNARLANLGKRIRTIRQERQLTLERVAEEAGLTKGFLSLFERGHKSVAVPTLLNLCSVLDVQVADLFDFPASEVVRGRGTPFDMGGRDLQEYLLTPATEQRIEVMRTVMDPHGGSGGTYRLDCDTIFVIVIRGGLHLQVGAREYELSVGDSTTFAGRTLHSWHNPLDEESEVVWVLAPPLPRKEASAAQPAMGSPGHDPDVRP